MRSRGGAVLDDDDDDADGHERGSMSAFAIGMVLALVACGGLVVDGGRMVMTRAEAADHAENAARVGSQELAFVGGRGRLDPARAVAAARGYLGAHGQRGTVSVSGNRVVVTVTATTSMTILRLVGVGSKRATATRMSEPING